MFGFVTRKLGRGGSSIYSRDFSIPVCIPRFDINQQLVLRDIGRVELADAQKANLVPVKTGGFLREVLKWTLLVGTMFTALMTSGSKQLLRGVCACTSMVLADAPQSKVIPVNQQSDARFISSVVAVPTISLLPQWAPPGSALSTYREALRKQRRRKAQVVERKYKESHVLHHTRASPTLAEREQSYVGVDKLEAIA